MQARNIILADHSGTAQAETHSQWFYISGHCGGISSVTCCLWLVNTQCVFFPGVPNNRGKKKEKFRTLHGHESCAWRSTLFFVAKPGGCSLNWEWLLCDSANKLLKMWQKKKGKERESGETSCAHKEWRSSDKWRGLLHHLKGGIIQARQMKFGRQWETNTASRLRCDF